MKYFTRFEIDNTERTVYDDRGEAIPGVIRLGRKTQTWISEDEYDLLPVEEKKLFIEVPSNQ